MGAERQRASTGNKYELQVGFSRALRVGDWVAVAGTAPIGDDGVTVGVGDLYVQTVRCFDIAARWPRWVHRSAMSYAPGSC